MRRLLATLCILVLAGCVGVPGGANDPAARLEALPAQIAGFQRQQIIRFPQSGLGAGLNYLSGASVATIYLYDRGQSDMAARPAENAAAELNTALAEIIQASQQGRYRITGAAAQFSLPGPDRNLTLQCAPFQLAFPDGRQAESFACTGFSRQHYLKLRFTGPRGSSPQLGAFAAALNPLL